MYDPPFLSVFVINVNNSLLKGYYGKNTYFANPSVDQSFNMAAGLRNSEDADTIRSLPFRMRNYSPGKRRTFFKYWMGDPIRQPTSE